jgi:menaquinone-dependent protoporphyrinogen IX oxidase
MSEKKRLVVFHSSAGNTQKVAQALAEALGADLEQIRPVHPYRVDITGKGAGNFLNMGRAVLGALLGLAAPIRSPEHDPAAYDLVIIGTPVYAGALAGATRSYLKRQKAKFRDVAFFSCSLDVNQRKLFVQMGKIVGKAPVAHASFDTAKVKAGDYAAQVQAFAAQL